MVAETTGTVDFIYEGKTYQTWYKIFGDLKGGKRPLLTLHGGPGFSHDYLLPHKELTVRAGIPVIFYDQVGNGHSTIIKDGTSEFWTPKIFMDEIDNLVEKLGIRDDFDILGHSWGGMLGPEYAASRSPKGLKRLIIANGLASVELYEKGVRELLRRFPEDFAAKVEKHELNGTTDSPEYKELEMIFLKKHVCTVDPWPQTLLASFGCFEANPSIYTTMLGPSEFCITGNLKSWTIVDILHNISCPTLMITSPNDEVQAEAYRPFFQRIPKIKWVDLPNSTHLPADEDPERYFDVVLQFLMN